MLCDAWLACRLPCSALHLITHCSTNCAHHKAYTRPAHGQCALYEQCGGSNGGATYHKCPRRTAPSACASMSGTKCEPKSKINGKTKRPSPSPKVCTMSVMSAVNVCPYLTCRIGRQAGITAIACCNMHQHPALSMVAWLGWPTDDMP